MIAEVKVDVLAETEGRIEDILYNIGDDVKKNRPLAYVKNTNPAYQYKKTNILSPLSGVIESVYVSKGSQVNKGDKIFTVQDKKSIISQIEVPGDDIKDIYIGLTGSLQFQESSETYKVQVKRIRPKIDVMTGTTTVQLSIVDKITNSNRPLMAGRLGKIQFKLNNRDGFILPRDSFNFKGKEIFVNYVEDNVIKSSKIKIGPVIDGEYEIKEGVREKQLVVIKSSEHIVEGDKVKFKEL